jgi:hypothetical protein
MFVFMLMQHSLSFPLKILAVRRISKHYWAKPHSLHQALLLHERLITTACFVAEFSCCVHRCKELRHLVTDIRHCSLFCSQNTHTLCVWSQDILVLKGTKHQMSVYDKMPRVYRFFLACLTFQLEGLKKYDQEAAYHRAH